MSVDAGHELANALYRLTSVKKGRAAPRTQGGVVQSRILTIAIRIYLKNCTINANFETNAFHFPLPSTFTTYCAGIASCWHFFIESTFYA